MLIDQDSGPSDLLAVAVGLAGIAACVTDAEGRHVFANAAYCDLLGFDAEELIGRSFTLLLPAQVRGEILHLYRGGVIAGNFSPVPAESTLVRKDGCSLVASFTSRLHKQENGECFVVSTLTDITGYKEAERTLRKTVLEQDAILANASVGILFTHSRVIQHCNPRGAEMLGYAPEELAGKPGIAIYPSQESYDRIGAEAAPLLSAGRSFHAEIELRRKDGELFWCRLIARAVDPRHTDQGTIWITEDVTEARRAKQALDETVLELEAIMANAPLGIAFTRDKKVTRHNKRFVEMFRLRADADENPPAASFYPSQEAYHEMSRQASPLLGAGKPFQCEMLLRRHDDSTFWAQITAYVINPAVPAQGTIWIVEDRTDKKAAEEAMLRSREELELHVEARTAELAGVNARLQAEIAERRLAEQRVHHMAQHDALTGLPNRILLKDRLTQVITLAKRNRHHAGIMFLDLDRFKTINDSLGHMLGDHLLKEVAQCIRNVVRASDTVSRLGGDEFVVVLPDLDIPGEAILVAEKLIDALVPAFNINGHDLHVTPSIGICVYPRDGENFETLMRNADTAMYQAKAGGGNGYRFFTPQMNQLAAQRFQLETCLRRAIAQDELRLYFQPIVSLPDRKMRGMEVLLRWQHPMLGLLSPGEFMGIAEETGLIIPIGEWVIKQACRQNRIWQEMGRPIVPLAINLSARQFRQPGLVKMISSTLEETGQRPELLELEITETTLLHQSPLTFQTLGKLGGMGISLSIDDFGTGYSSLSYLKRLPVHKLKIDRSFIQDINDSSDDLAIVSAVIALARTLQLGVVAEGVESQAQLDLLSHLGCEFAQGYFFSQPLPPGDATRLFDLKPAI